MFNKLIKMLSVRTYGYNMNPKNRSQKRELKRDIKSHATK